MAPGRGGVFKVIRNKGRLPTPVDSQLGSQLGINKGEGNLEDATWLN